MRFMFPRRSLLTPFFLFCSLGLLSPVWGQTGCPSVLTYGQSASCALENVGETDAFTFSAQAGDRVIMAVGRTLGTFQPKIELNGPTGTMVCPVTGTSTWVEINGCLLPTGGTYTISVWDNADNETGNYGIYLQRLNGPGNSSPLSFGQTLSSNISIGTEMDSFTFSGATGDRVMIAGAMTSGLLDPQVRLYGPDGIMLCQAFSSSGGMAEINDCPLPSNGMYTLLFADYNYSETGNYGLYLQRLNNPESYMVLAYGQSTGGDISIVPEMDTYTFSGEAGERVLINMAVTLGTLDPQIRLYRPDGTLLCSASYSNGGSAEINNCPLPNTGTYTLLVNDLGDTETGTYRIYLQRLTGALNPTPLSFGLPTTADITLAAEMDTYTFSASVGDRVLVNMAVSSGSLDPFIRLFGPDGTPVCQAQNASSGAAEINDCPLPATGTYQLLAGDYGSTETGNYGIFLQRLNQPGNTTAVTYGQNITKDIILAAEMDTLTFVGTANDRVMIDMAVTLGGLDPQIRLYRPDGTPLCSSFYNNGGSTEINHCILPETGTYTILAHDYGNTEAGSYRVYLQRLSNPANATPISFGQTLSGDIALAAEMDAFAFTAAAGDRVMIAMAVSSGLLDPQIRLYDQSGTPVCQSIITSGAAAEINDCPLTVGGTYTIITSDIGNTETGNYGLYLQRLNNPSGVTALVYGQTVAGDILGPAEMDTFSFLGTAGKQILISMAVTLGALDPQIRLFRPDGTILCSDYYSNGGSAEINNCTLPETGTYTILANDYGNTEVGTYHIYLQALSNPANATSISFGQTLSGDIALAAEMDAFAFTATAGDRVMIAMAVSSGLLDPQIRLYDPEGNLIRQVETTSGGTAEINEFSLPVSGTYALLANDNGNTETGNYGFYLQRLNNPANGIPLGSGQAVDAEINQAAEMKTYTFQAIANDRAVFSMKATSGNLDPQVRVYRLNGTLLCWGYYANGGTGQTSTCVFPETGRYTILTNDYGGTDTGGFTLLSRLPESGLLDLNPVAGLIASGTASGPFSPSSTSYSLRNIGGGTINWTASKTQPWISISETSGMLTAGETKSISVSINQEAKNLSPGLYLDTITFTNATNGNGNDIRPVSLMVNASESGILSITPATTFVAFGTVSGPFSPSSINYQLKNIGEGTISWTASKNKPWINLSETSGVLSAGGTKTITVSINQEANKLTPGLFFDTIAFNNTTNRNGNTTRSVSLTVDLNAPGMRIFFPLVISK